MNSNFYQEAKHGELESEVRRGVLTDATEFAMLIELIEYDGLRYVHQVVGELDRAMGGGPAELFDWLTPGARTFAKCNVPAAYDLIRSNNKPNGHLDRYRKSFLRLQGEQQRSP